MIILNVAAVTVSQMHPHLHTLQKLSDTKMFISVQMVQEVTITLMHGQKLMGVYTIRFLQRPRAIAEIIMSATAFIPYLRLPGKNLPET